MYTTILRLLWPYLGRYVANYAADFLQQRRVQRLKSVLTGEEQSFPAGGGDKEVDCPPCPPCPPEATDNSAYNTFWYTASGLALGGAFGLIAYLFIRDTRSQMR
jgi:hypothetical protein